MDDASSLMAASLASDLMILRVEDAPCTLHLGVSEAERAQPQTVLISAAITVARGVGADDLAATIDYDAIIGFLRTGLPARGPFKLIETVADRIAAHCLSLGDDVIEAEIAVKKPSVLAGAGMVSVLLRRSR
jgi:dihydroneopterin aldolase